MFALGIILIVFCSDVVQSPGLLLRHLDEQLRSHDEVDAVDADKLPLLLPTDMRVLDAFGVVEKRASVVVAAEQVEYQGMAS